MACGNLIVNNKMIEISKLLEVLGLCPDSVTCLQHKQCTRHDEVSYLETHRDAVGIILCKKASSAGSKKHQQVRHILHRITTNILRRMAQYGDGVMGLSRVQSAN